MFRFFRRKKSAPEAPVASSAPEPVITPVAPAPVPQDSAAAPAIPAPEAPAPSRETAAGAIHTAPAQKPEPASSHTDTSQTPAPAIPSLAESAPNTVATDAAAATVQPKPAPATESNIVQARFAEPAENATPPSSTAAVIPATSEGEESAPVSVVAPPPVSIEADTSATENNTPEQIDTPRKGWLARLKGGLAKTGHSITTVFTGTQIDDALYEDLETALLLADTGVSATEYLLQDLKRRVKQAHARNPQEVRELLRAAVTDLLTPLEKTLIVGAYHPTVIMIAGVNGAGKTTSIGKLTKHMADAGASVLLAAADTFRAAAREQLEIWADRNKVEIISQQGADPAAVSFDAVAAGRARDKDVVLVDTAGRLPTQKHLMEELAKIRRVIGKADLTAPHEVLLVIDGNTGQNALAQVKAFDDVIKLTGLIVTKLDGTAKGGVLCAIAREHPIPVYFIGIGEALEDLQTFRAAEFARALTD